MTSHSADNGSGSGPDEPGTISTSLLARVKTSDPEAWRRLVTLYGPLIYLWCRQSRLQPDDAGDVLQEVLGAVAGRVERFRRERPGDSFRGWLWTITRNKIRDHFRRLAGQAQAQGGTDAQQLLAQIPDQPPDSLSSQPHCGDRNGLERRAIELVRAGVEDRTWQAFWRVAVDGQPVADVAQELGMSTKAVYAAKYRVRRLILQELDDVIR